MTIPIYIHYDITKHPWGGINSFFRSFRDYVIKYGYCRLVQRIEDDYKILLMGANAYGRVERIKCSEIGRVKQRGIKIIHRLDGLRSTYTKNKNFLKEDLQQVELSELANWLIFQSKYCCEEFKKIRQINASYSIVANGVNQEIFNDKFDRIYLKNRKVRILSVSWSNNINKGFKTIAEFSVMSGVQSFFIGNWCKDVDSKQVTIIKPLHREDLAQQYRKADIFLHSAGNDPCSNVVLEALSSGLPVIYHNSGGTFEIVRDCGVSLGKPLKVVLENILDNYIELINRVRISKDRFSIRFAANRYIEIFKQVLKGEL